MASEPDYDVIIIGAGHNGLVAAGCLARAGLRVVVLERRQIPGGAAATEEVFPGYQMNTGADDLGLFRPEVAAHLQLERHGLEWLEGPAVAFAPQPDGRSLILWRDQSRSLGEIARFSAADARKFPSYLRQVRRFTPILTSMMTRTPPDPANGGVSQWAPWLRTALDVRRLGQRDMMEFLRILPLSAYDYLASWFESPALQGLLGSAGVLGTMQGPRASGTAFMLLYQGLGAGEHGFRPARFARHGAHGLVEALLAAVRALRVEVRTQAPVAGIQVDEYRARGVVLESGERISARVVISSAEVRHTLIELVGASRLPVKVVRRAQNIRLKGSTARVNLALRELPAFTGQQGVEALTGHIVISPSLEYVERAYDDAKYGRLSTHPVLTATLPTLLEPGLAPAGRHILSVTAQFAPYHLREGDWGAARQDLGDRVVATLAEFAPKLPELILHRQVLTPLDYQQQYGLTEGGIYHGQMALDQLLFMRPIPGYGRYRTPVDRLYFCGAGSHPGGGVTGAPGFNAAREVLADWPS